jgi:hypothetical protein
MAGNAAQEKSRDPKERSLSVTISLFLFLFSSCLFRDGADRLLIVEFESRPGPLHRDQASGA